DHRRRRDRRRGRPDRDRPAAHDHRGGHVTETPAPTPASVSGDVPVENWRSRLAEAEDAEPAERHEHLGALLDDLDEQVGSLCADSTGHSSTGTCWAPAPAQPAKSPPDGSTSTAAP